MKRSYFILLTHQDRIRVQFTRDKGVIVDFVVQYEAEIQDRWHPVVRYDLAHGFLHRDRLDPQGELTRKEPVPYGSLSDAMTEAIRDLKVNWPEYRRWYKERLP